MGQKQGTHVPSGRSIEEDGGAGLSRKQQKMLAPGSYIQVPQGTNPYGHPVPHPMAFGNHAQYHRKQSKRSSQKAPPGFSGPHPMGIPYPMYPGSEAPPAFLYPGGPPPVMYGPPRPGSIYQPELVPVGYPRYPPSYSPDMVPNGTSSMRSAALDSRSPNPQVDQSTRWSKTIKEPNRISKHVDENANEIAIDANDVDIGGVVNTVPEKAVPESIKQIFEETSTAVAPSQLPAPPEPENAPQVDKERTNATPVADPVYTLIQNPPTPIPTTPRFVEVGEAEGHVARFLIDGSQTGTDTGTAHSSTFNGDKIKIPLTVHRAEGLGSGHEVQSLTMYMFEEDKGDVVICCNAVESEVATALRNHLEVVDLQVHIAAITEKDMQSDVTNAARAVFNSRVVVVFLSESSGQSRHIKDLVSLATVTGRPVFPVAIGSKPDIRQSLSVELNLQLDQCNWTYLALQDGVAVGGFRDLVDLIAEQAGAQRSYYVIDEDYGKVSSWAVLHRRAFQVERPKDSVRISTRLQRRGGEDQEDGEDDKELNESEQPASGKATLSASEFWDLTFPQNVTVSWDKFRSQLRSYYLTQLATHLPRSCMPRVMEALRQGLVETSQSGQEVVTRDALIAFCTVRGCELDIWPIILGIARHNQAVMDIFDQESTIRIPAIEEIGGYGSPAVIWGLRDLMRAGDPKIRCLATEALSRCMLPGDKLSFASLMAALDDADWAVRKAACHGMARLAAPQAIDRIRRIGRNDNNAEVKSAAAFALAEIEAGQPKPVMTSQKSRPLSTKKST